MTPNGLPRQLRPDQLGGGWWFVFVVALAILGYVLINGGDGDKHHGSGADNSHTGSKTTPGSTVTVKVDRHVDGDTAKVFYEGRSEYVRYIGVDTPETVKEGTPVECFGKQASAFNRNAIEGRTVRLVFDRELRDQYDRLLAYVYVDGKMLNAEILRRGYGTTLEVPPNTARANQFAKLESEARDADRGLWSACG